MAFTVTPSHPFLIPSGRDIDLVAVPSELTVSQAAAFLRMSERRLNDLLDAGEITFQRESGERRIHRNTLLDFEHRQEQTRAWLDEMVRENQEMGLYDD